MIFRRRRLLCVRCGKVIREKDYPGKYPGYATDQCSHLFFDTRDRVGIAIGSAHASH